eukprot:SAG31_NODE_35453_length_323_cov_0.678571_1_plen_76_part_10
MPGGTNWTILRVEIDAQRLYCPIVLFSCAQRRTQESSTKEIDAQRHGLAVADGTKVEAPHCKQSAAAQQRSTLLHL